MSSKWIWITAAVGIGAYAFGRFDEWQRRQGVPKDAPRPPIPRPSIPSKDAFGADPDDLPPTYEQEWEEAVQRYAIDYYPPEAEPYLGRLMPPPSANGVTVAANCKAIAVGEDWWYGAHERALAYKEQGDSTGKIIDKVLRDFFPSCLSHNTDAVLGLRREFKDWLEQSTERNASDSEPLLTRS